jgi:hypothetical protein
VATENTSQRANLLPRWARWTGWIFLLLSLLFIGRIVFEETVLTCAQGPQMVGFAMAHGALPFLRFAFVFVPLTLFWLIAAVIWGLGRKWTFARSEWLQMFCIIATFGLLLMPYTTWMRLDVTVCGTGAHAGQFMGYAASSGALGLVKQILAKGYDINRDSGGGSSALTGAAVGGQERVARFLIASGADVNHHDGFTRETPLMAAAETGSLDMVRLLLESGADPCGTNRDGQNALSMAQRFHKPVVAEYLNAHFQCPPPPPPPSCGGENQETCVDVH